MKLRERPAGLTASLKPLKKVISYSVMNDYSNTR